MEPEHLDAEGARLGRGRSWLVLGVVLAVVVGLVVLRFTSQEPDVSPRPAPRPMISASATSHTWPADLPPGLLLVGSAGRVYAVDSRDGRVTPTRVPAYSSETSMTSLGTGVLVWGATKRSRSVVMSDGSVQPVSGALRTAAAFLPGPDGSVWAAEDPGSRRTTWRRVDADGKASTRVSVDGDAASDGAGGLLSVTDAGFRSAFPTSSRARQVGDVIATGPDGYVRRTCARGECRFTLHRHAEEPDSVLSTAVGEDTTGGTLSPANRRLAVTETVGDTSTLRVSVVGTGQIDEIFDQPRGSTRDAVWLDDRWLALISVDQLMLYDAEDDRVVVPAVPLSSLGPLAWRPA
ncbi:hypothetical protein [Microlunatus antarcticus]|uniref:PQQ-like domain-containing protein n=1 Tax=Microlunatus antarcticus TaxID=53388 RepID=A0A7W5JX29_9ACTN|nr:hypothetical protein [Microlunatus antarcticus]MBB3327899.1 hypothetical protein [Microlunatus antarcticus]